MSDPDRSVCPCGGRYSTPLTGGPGAHVTHDVYGCDVCGAWTLVPSDEPYAVEMRARVAALGPDP